MHGSDADSQCLSLFQSRRVFILVCGPSSMKLLLKFPLASVGFGIPQSFFPLCLCLLSICSALVLCSALLSSCSSSILVSLKDGKRRRNSTSCSTQRGYFVVSWRVQACVLLARQFFGFFWFSFSSPLFWNLYAEGSASQETIFNQTTAAELSHTPLPKAISKIT